MKDGDDFIPLEEAERRARSKTMSDDEYRAFYQLQPGAPVPRQRDTRPKVNGHDAEGPRLSFFSAAELAGQAPPLRRWAVPVYVPARVVTLFSGHGGVGKTIILLNLLIAKAGGQSWFGHEIDPGPCLGAFGEEDRDELHRRIHAMSRALGVDLADLPDLTLTSLADLGDVLAAPSVRGDAILPTPAFDELRAQALDLGVKLITLDPAADLFGGDEINRSQVRQFIAMLRRLAIEIDGSVILAAHPSREGLRSETGYSGSTAWHNSVRSLIYMTKPGDNDGEGPDDDARVVRHLKCNLGALAPDLPLRWQDGLFVPDLPAGGMLGSIERGTAEKEAESAFLAALKTLGERQVNVSATPTSNNYAPTSMTRQRLTGRFKKRDMETAMGRLFEAKRIASEKYGKPSNPRYRIVEARHAG